MLECRVRVLLVAGVRYSSWGMSTKSLIIMNNMVSWHLVRLAFRDSHSRLSNIEGDTAGIVVTISNASCCLSLDHL